MVGVIKRIITVVQKLNDFVIKNYLWLIIAFTLFFIWLNPVLFLAYVEVIRWPLIVLLILWIFKREISILTTEKLKSFFIKFLGVEVQGSLAEQNKENPPINESENLPGDMIQEKIKELSQTKETQSAVIDTLRRNLAVKEIELDFERIYNRIFGSQFSLLENLIVGGGSLKISQVADWYSARICAQFPIFKEWALFSLFVLFRNKWINRMCCSK